MRFKPLLIPLAVAGCAGLAAQSAVAGPSGYPIQAAPVFNGALMIRVGAAYVEPDSSALSTVQRFSVDDPTIEDDNPIPVDVGVKLDLDNDTTWYLSAVYMPMEHWGIELYHYNSASHDAKLFSNAYTRSTFIGDFREDIGDFDSYTTSLLANWYPLGANCLIQPYVGLGVAYVDIEEDFLRPVFRDGPANRHGLITVGSDFSWTAQIGVDFNFGPGSAWQVNASAMYVDASPHINLGFDTDTLPPGFGAPVTLPVRVRDDFDLDPWMFNLGIGYKFSF
ncbi:OmpW/AlkL family protein [Microbulbifer hainanensis]|uniref:OmpW/AlkL family protein n=1 Tax=Microbulbifer hainanensis TaxID=2735675 RepID=UPI0018678A2C|nr:OmpW family outer membrane protein [Microbulbifer hainanensis]